MNTLLDWIESPFVSIRDVLMDRIGVGGYSIPETIRKNRENTRRAHEELAERAARNGWTADEFARELDVVQRRRRTHTLTTQRNVAASVRGYARSLNAVGRPGRFYNVTTLDERTTHVCLGYVGMSWPKPYSAIPEKPPRIHRLIHRCRSYLEFRETAPVDQGSFIEQFNNADDDLKLQLLKPARFKAYKQGRLQITSYPLFEAAILYTLVELGIDDNDDSEDPEEQ